MELVNIHVMIIMQSHSVIFEYSIRVNNAEWSNNRVMQTTRVLQINKLGKKRIREVREHLLFTSGFRISSIFHVAPYDGPIFPFAPKSLSDRAAERFLVSRRSRMFQTTKPTVIARRSRIPNTMTEINNARRLVSSSLEHSV